MHFAQALLISAVGVAASASGRHSATLTTRDDSPSSDGVAFIDSINQWRQAKGVPTLTYNSQLEANSAKTGQDDGGVNENHELNPGSYAQCITPGFAENPNNSDLNGMSPFDLAYVGWLCEAPFGPLTEPGPNGDTPCQTVQKVENLIYDGTGHADILNSDSYATIGCSFTQNPNADAGSPYQGLWVCDLGF